VIESKEITIAAVKQARGMIYGSNGAAARLGIQRSMLG
jgi:hypothetical protein